MFDTQAVARSFGKAAGQYDQHARLQQHVRRHCLNSALPLWPKGALVLDLGCGTGALHQEICQQRRDVSLYGLDIAWGMCQQAHAKNFPVTQASSQHIPFAPASFDGVFSSLMLQWVDRPAMVFAEIEKLLKPGGSAVISTLTDGTLKELKAAFAAQDGYPHISDFHVPHNILCCAEQAGLKLVSAHQQTIVEYYPDTIALMRGLQAIGASNKQRGRHKGMMTPAKLAQVEQHYRTHQHTKQGLPASWQVLILVLEKGGL